MIIVTNIVGVSSSLMRVRNLIKHKPCLITYVCPLTHDHSCHHNHYVHHYEYKRQQ